MSKLEAGGGHWKVEVGIEEEACIYRHGSSAYDKLVLQTMSNPKVSKPVLSFSHCISIIL